MSALGPLDHIARTPLPWRTEPELTECGKTVADIGGRIVSRTEVEARIRAVGQKRAAYETCMTCADTSDRRTRHQRRGDETVNVLARELGAVQHAYPPRVVTGNGLTTREEPSELWERKQRLAAELEAITALVAEHRDEFDAYLTGLNDTVKLADRRRGTRRRAGGAR
jgi:hypothetical protein